MLAQAGAADQDRPVVLWLPNGASVIAAMLATLKAGGFYVVIDPRYPVERNSAILNNSEAGWVITGPVLTRLKPAVRPGLDKKLPFIFVPKTRSRPRPLLVNYSKCGACIIYMIGSIAPSSWSSYLSIE